MKPITVSELNHQMRLLIEQHGNAVSVAGEISGLSKPASGHLYFTLKDSQAQIRCAFFKTHRSHLSHPFDNGQAVIITGQLSLYEARGDYQLIVHAMEPVGKGHLYLQFEALKKALQQEGLFESARKKPLPRSVQVIGIITSPTGAVLHDILTTLNRRYPLVETIIYPSDVQGKEAPRQLINALLKANQDKEADVLILARGGGSIEDLWAFNDPNLARAIVQSNIPIVSGIGHETDTTIADFVADLRAPTPTAAAEMVTPHQKDLRRYIQQLVTKLYQHMQRLLTQLSHQMTLLKTSLQSPETGLHYAMQSLDFLTHRLEQRCHHIRNHASHRLHLLLQQLDHYHPTLILEAEEKRLLWIYTQLIEHSNKTIYNLRLAFQQHLTQLITLNPLKTLERGYVIATHNGKLLTDARDVHPCDLIELQLAKGQLVCQVIG